MLFPLLRFLLDSALLNEGDRIWKGPRQDASCRLKDEEEVKEEKGRRRREKGGGQERPGELKWKDPNSQIAPITGTFRSQCLENALAAVPHSLPRSSSSRSLCPLLFISPPSFFFHFILRSQRGYYWWGTSCTKFSCSVALTTPWELWTSSEALHDSLQPTFGTVSCVCL